MNTPEDVQAEILALKAEERASYEAEVVAQDGAYRQERNDLIKSYRGKGLSYVDSVRAADVDIKVKEFRSRSARGRKNKGKTYSRKAPVRAEGKWFATFTDEAWVALLSKKSWVLFGVFRSLIKRARSEGMAKEINRDEVAAEVGCSETQVSRAYGVLAEITIKDKDGENRPLISKLSGGYQGHCSTFAVRGYRMGKE